MQQDHSNHLTAHVSFTESCDQCKKTTDGLMTCTYSHDGSTTQLCPDCIKDSGFCLRCGHYSAGKESFDFSNMPGYCLECQNEIMSELADQFDEDNAGFHYEDEDGAIQFEPCSQCDGHDACRDFGCAFKHGLGGMVDNEDNLPF